MTLIAVSAKTPFYVLINGNHPIGPALKSSPEGEISQLVYGFSDKCAFDRFCAASSLDLRPYPLVRGYLRNQIEPPHAGLLLVVLDAPGPLEPHLDATTMETLLPALEARAAQVAVTHRLALDPKSSTYRIFTDSANR